MNATTRRMTWGCFAVLFFVICSQPALGYYRPKKPRPDFTKGEKLESQITAWALGSTGASGDFYHNEPRQILVRGVAQGSPADGKLRESDVILGILSPASGQDTGKGLFTTEARFSLSKAIEEAEKRENGGKLVLNVWRPEGHFVTNVMGKAKTKVFAFQPDTPITGKVMTVAITLPVMGSYSAASPWACEKSEAIVKKSAEAILKEGFFRTGATGNKVPLGLDAMLDALGLLATGDKAYISAVRDYVHALANGGRSLDITTGVGPGTWEGAYKNVLMCEYYLLTKDEQVLPDIKGLSVYLASGVSGVGSWGHGMAEVSKNGMYGPPMAYGAMNQASLVCALSLVLAQKCGIKEPVVDDAVRRALDFARFYVDKGCIPYGDHVPMPFYDNNGRMSIAAVLYDLAGKKPEAEFFTRMTLASYPTREGGHTGHFFAWQWGALGAARGGPEAAASFAKNTRYFTELERRPDGRCVYQPQLPEQSRKNYGFRTTGQRLMQYCLPRKVLYITGKGGSCVTPITGAELKNVVSAPLFDPAKLSTPELLKALGNWAINVRSAAAQELGRRDDIVVEDLIVLLDNPNRYARYGACDGLSFAGRQSTNAVDTLIKIIENDKDMTMRYFALNALTLNKKGEEGNGLGIASRRATTALLKLAIVDDPVQDPTKKLARQVSRVLFLPDPPGFFPSGKGAEALDKALLIPALKAFMKNPNGEARSIASEVLPRLPLTDLEQLWSDIYLATTVPAPSGVMYQTGMHINGIETMAKNNIKEGVDYAAFYVLYRRGWGGGKRREQGLPVIVQYGRAMEPYFEMMEKEAPKFLKGGPAKNFRTGLEAARKAPEPKLVSIQEHIKNKPEKAFLDWLANGKKAVQGKVEEDMTSEQ